MTTATVVPVTTDMDGDELDAEDAWHAIRRCGVKLLLVDSFMRFRYGDGFTNSRALALQTAFSVLPFLLAMAGLAADIDVEKAARVLASTIGALTPGPDTGDILTEALRSSDASEREGELALAFGLLFSVASMTTAMAQIERGLNRIYGIRRDRSAPQKYGRAAVFTAVLAVPVALGFLLLVAGGPFAEAMAETYGWTETTVDVWNVMRWPTGLVLMTFVISLLLDHAPRRRQPSLSWLALGSGVAVVLTMTASGMLALYTTHSASFGTVYGPVAGVMALLLWCYLTSIALFYGAALAAQLEAFRAGVEAAVTEDPGPPPVSRRNRS